MQKPHAGKVIGLTPSDKLIERFLSCRVKRHDSVRRLKKPARRCFCLSRRQYDRFVQKQRSLKVAQSFRDIAQKISQFRRAFEQDFQGVENKVLPRLRIFEICSVQSLQSQRNDRHMLGFDPTSTFSHHLGGGLFRIESNVSKLCWRQSVMCDEVTKRRTQRLSIDIAQSFW